MNTLSDIRSTFLNFFKGLDHEVVPSGSLVPHNDPTLLFTSAGMVPFKDVFTGKERKPYKRATSSQKCLRAGGKHNDLDQVGYTARHHTFFEMLGNFSFGDYFKEEAIAWSFDLITQQFGLSADRLLVTVYHTDDEAFNLWRKHMPQDRIIRIATDDNFWSMGDTGPCGPCSEIFYDYGAHVPGGPPGSKDADLDRFVEVWNLVFMQYEQLRPGERVPLPLPSIDTGMGLERMGSVLQGKNNNFDTDLFQALVHASQDLLPLHEPLASHRVIADHLRASAFLIADGVLPSNEGRGYVLRRILRRAMRHAHSLGGRDPVLHRLLPVLVGEMGAAYGELKRAEALIASTFEQEEERFIALLERGMHLIEESTKHLGRGGTLSGDVAFKLYDTYGFPIDLTQDVLRARDIGVDEKGFNAAMEAQKNMSRAAWSGSGDAATSAHWFEWSATPFLGYATLEAQSTIQGIIRGDEKVHYLNDGEKGWIITDQTPFYPTSGGQTADHGVIYHHDGQAHVVDCTKQASGVVVHAVEVSHGQLKVGDLVHMEVDAEKRSQTAAHHSATHLLHHALRSYLGAHVAQKGSLVEPSRLRFDFTHHKALSAEDIQHIETQVNKAILENNQQICVETTPDEAFGSGAIGLFGEKYGDTVRMIQLGASKELCGGTHVSHTGKIGLFKITSEASVAAGVRRIEAVCGLALMEYISQLQTKIDTLNTAMRDQKKKSSDHSPTTFDREFMGRTDSTYSLIIEKGSVLASFRGRVDALRAENPHTIFFIYGDFDNKISFVLGVSEDLPHNARAITQELSAMLGGNGGGKETLAQGGGPNVSALPDVLKKLQELL